jgi:hypothetical protein
MVIGMWIMICLDSEMVVTETSDPRSDVELDMDSRGLCLK